MKEITLLIKTLDPQPIYSASQGLGLFIFATITPVLLVIAVSIRVTETQLDTVASLGKWGRAVKDFLLWGAVLSVYFGIAYLIADFMETVYRVIDEIGSREVIANQAAEIIRSIQERIGPIDTFMNNLDLNTLATRFLYQISITVIGSLGAFLRVAHAIGYSFVFIYGLIAIPISITSNLKLLRGWALLLGGILLWPIVEGVMMGLFSLVFSNVAHDLLSRQPINSIDEASYQFYFTIVNFVLAAVMVAAPLVSSALVSNSSSLTQLVVPFMGAALAASFGGPAMPKKAAAAVLNAFRFPGSDSKGGIPRFGPQPKPSAMMSGASSSSADLDGNNPAPEARMPENPTPHPPESNSAKATTAPTDEALKHKRQKQRKGVFVWKTKMAKKPPQA